MKMCRSIFYQLLFTSICIAAFSTFASAQENTTSTTYTVQYIYVDKDSSFNGQSLRLQTSFVNQPASITYIQKIPSLLLAQGYPAASVDSTNFDSSFARVVLYLGPKQVWSKLNTNAIESKALDFSGYNEKNFINKGIDYAQLESIRQRLLLYYENNGYPFAEVLLDSIKLNPGAMEADLKVNKGVLYHIDSIRIKGKVKINSNFMQRYLGIPNGSIYSKEKLDGVSKRLLELPYLQEVQPSELLMLGTGSVLDLYLKQKKSSQINFLIGFLPANNETGKLQLTGDVNLNLKNSLGNGESIIFNWQQLQLSSPRLILGYQQPYIFKSAFGLDFGFELFKKDSSFVQLNAQLGVQYLLSANQSGKIFIQNQSTFLLASGVDTDQVKITRKLPINVDVKAVNVGIDYELNKTNYRFNPKSGNEIRIIGSVGIKTIGKNNDILSLKDPSFDYATLYDSIKLKTYQVKLKLSGAHYFPVSKQSTIKTAFNGAIVGSQYLFRNELYQIGGFKLLRGFDEESIYASQYGVFTAEYRNLISLNSYLYTFIDAAWVKNKYQDVNVSNQFTSAGIGIALETKAGLLNLSFAVGKRNDTKLDLRGGSKIHFGYINYF